MRHLLPSGNLVSSKTFISIMSNLSSSDINRPSPFWTLLAFIILVEGVGIGIGFLTGPDAWYASLAKPSFNPPNWIFGPVWTVLYIMIAVAGWRIWKVAFKSSAMVIWIVQMILNWLWTPVFFTNHAPVLALAIIVALLIAIIAFIVQARKYDKIASWLFVPYAVWVSFAALLNASIVFMN